MGERHLYQENKDAKKEKLLEVKLALFLERIKEVIAKDYPADSKVDIGRTADFKDVMGWIKDAAEKNVGEPRVTILERQVDAAYLQLSEMLTDEHVNQEEALHGRLLEEKADKAAHEASNKAFDTHMRSIEQEIDLAAKEEVKHF